MASIENIFGAPESSGGGSGVSIVNITYDELVALKNSSTLVKGQVYLLLDYMTTYIQPVTNASKSSGIIEPLYLVATDIDKLHSQGKSKLYPQDIIYYEITGDIGDGNGTEGFTKGKIYRRIDTIRNNDIGTDWRHIKYNRGVGVEKLLFEDYTGCYNNVIKAYYLFNTVVGNNFANNIISNYFDSNTIGDSFVLNNISDGFANNVVGNSVSYNEFGYNFSSNTIGDNLTRCVFMGSVISNIFGDNFKYITVMADFQGKDISANTNLHGKQYRVTIYRQPDNTYQYSYVDSYGDTIIEDIP